MGKGSKQPFFQGSYTNGQINTLKKCLTSAVISEECKLKLMQIKMQIKRQTEIPITVSRIKKPDNSKHWGGCGGNVTIGNKNSLAVFQKVKPRIPNDPSNCTARSILKRHEDPCSNRNL